MVKPDWSKWVGSFEAWPAWRKSEWVDWINRLELAFGQIWKDVGLFEFIQLSKCKFTMDKPIMGSALLFWSGSFNCFRFPCGAMSVSLFDISSLTGLPCIGEEISALLTLPPGVEYNTDLKPSYPAFVRSAYDKSKPVNAEEYISFLLTLICKYMVFSAGKSPTKEFIPLAAALAHALAPISSTVPARNLLTYGFMFKNAMENKRSFEECFKFFASLSVDRFDADFAVFLSRSHDPSCLNTLNSRCGVELYAPNQFCWQLGNYQDIPFPPLFSFNHSYPLRFMIGESNILTAKLAEITKTLQTMILPDPPFRLSCTPSYRNWWQDYFHPRFLGVLDNISVLAPRPVTKKFEEKKVAEKSGDLESAMVAQISKPDLPRRAPKTHVKRKIATPADSTEENTPSKQRRTGRIKRPAMKPSATKKLIKFASPPESTSASDKTEDVSLESVATTDPVEDISAGSGESNSGSSRTKSGDGPSPTTKVRGSRFFSCIANKSFKTVRPNELIDLSPDKENTPTLVASPVRQVDVDDIESVVADVSMIDDNLENELLAQLDMLMDPLAKSGSAADSKGKAVAEEANPDIDLLTQEQISFAIMTLQELLDGDPSLFCKVPDQPAAFEAAQILTDNIAAVFKKKEEFLAAKVAHVTQVKHLQELKEEISNLEAKLSELRNQVPLAEQTEKSLAEQRNKLRTDMEVGLKSTAKIKDQLPSFTASADEAAEEIKNMRKEWS
ncbi:hypothetical protein SLEP1_g30387 [Rubroshorea leprosula]|uniref:Aminotransferase-like plant mobile domain-containing protein n=1 Tax=Rubroshorea leprosula TaxID=152421 RepID=A0AAV5JZX7_9ROSI|nr:hypothetical protein SLEP1_g30387 [Rubroshorea leprosula]